MEEIRREIAHAVEVTFWLSTVYCLLFRPEVPGFRYNGFYTNPNPYGLYMAVVICIFLAELDTCIKREKKNWKRMAACAAGIDIALFFLYKTQCATGILALGVAGIIWLTGYMGKGIPKVWQKQCIRSVFLIIVAFLPVFAVMERGINTIPNVLHTTITYPEEMNHAMLDMDLLPDGEEVVYAAAEEDTATDVVTSVATVPETAAPQPEQTSFIDRVRQRLQDASSLNILLSGRMYNYTAYIRDMNLFGNDKKAIAYGIYTNYAHNGILAYAHTYGIYMIIPYIMTNLYLFYYAIRYRKKSFLPLGIFAVFFVENMMDNVDIPFHWVVWFVFALISGTLFREEESGECSRR